MKKIKWSKSLYWEGFLAGRYLRTKKKDGFLSVITAFSFVGICLGVATLIIVMSVMGGFREELLSRIIGMKGHAMVYSLRGSLPENEDWLNKMKMTKHVTQVCPLVERQSIIISSTQTRGVLALGLSWGSLNERKMLKEALLTSCTEADFEGDVVWIGKRMAELMGLKKGDLVSLMDPQGEATPFGTVPKQREFCVAGIFEMGMIEYDKNVVMLPLTAAQDFFGLPGALTQFEIFTDNLEKNDSVVADIRGWLPRDCVVLGWKHGDSHFFQAMQIERNVMFLILTLIIFIASFNIISGLVMLVKDKTKDIAILKTIGASRFSVMRIFMMTGAAIGLCGTILGVVLGICVTLHLEGIIGFLQKISGRELFNPEVYFLTSFPYKLDGGEVLGIATLAIVLSLLAALYPSFRAARLDPVVAFREG